MAKKFIYVSDLSGQDIGEGQEAQILITWRENGRKVGATLDATLTEAKEMARHGKIKRFSTGRRKQNGGGENTTPTTSGLLAGV